MKTFERIFEERQRRKAADREAFNQAVADRDAALAGWNGRRQPGPELPANQAARERQEERERQATPEAHQARAEAAAKAQQQRNTELGEWQRLRSQAQDAAAAAEGMARQALANLDLEQAVAHQQRAQALRALLPQVNQEIKRRFDGPMINIRAAQI